MPRKFVASTDKIQQRDFPKVAVLKRSAKGAMTGFFRRGYQQRVRKNEMRKQFGVNADETYQ